MPTWKLFVTGAAVISNYNTDCDSAALASPHEYKNGIKLMAYSLYAKICKKHSIT